MVLSLLEYVITWQKTGTRTLTLDKGRVEFMLPRELVSNTTLETAFEGTGVHQCWSIVKYHLLGA